MTEMISLLMNVDNESPSVECHTIGENNIGSPKNRKNRSNYPFLDFSILHPEKLSLLIFFALFS